MSKRPLLEGAAVPASSTSSTAAESVDAAKRLKIREREAKQAKTKGQGKTDPKAFDWEAWQARLQAEKLKKAEEQEKENPTPAAAASAPAPSPSPEDVPFPEDVPLGPEDVPQLPMDPGPDDPLEMPTSPAPSTQWKELRARVRFERGGGQQRSKKRRKKVMPQLDSRARRAQRNIFS